MKLEPIEYNGGVIWVDKEVVPRGIYYNSENGKIVPLVEEWRKEFGDKYLHIVAQSPNLSIPNIPYVELEEENVEDKAYLVMMNYLTDGNPEGDFKHSTIGADDNKNWWIAGYKAASAKKWSDEDIEKAIQFGIDITCKHTTPTHGTNFDKVEDDKNNYIVSLQPKIKSIEIEMTQGAYDFLDCPVIGEERPMTYEKDGKIFLKVKKINYD